MMRWILVFVALSTAAQVKDLSVPLFTGLAKVYGGVPFRSRLEIKALATELKSAAEESDKDNAVLAKKYADSTGRILPGKNGAYHAEFDPLQAVVIPIKTKIPLRIVLPEDRIDSLRLTLGEDMALTPFVQIVADTTKKK